MPLYKTLILLCFVNKFNIFEWNSFNEKHKNSSEKNLRYLTLKIIWRFFNGIRRTPAIVYRLMKHTDWRHKFGLFCLRIFAMINAAVMRKLFTLSINKNNFQWIIDINSPLYSVSFPSATSFRLGNIVYIFQDFPYRNEFFLFRIVFLLEKWENQLCNNCGLKQW